MHGPHLDDERATYLSDYKSVLSDLPAANGEGWDLAFATVVHIAYADGFLDELVTEFKERALTHVERLEAETYGDRPTLQLRQNEPPVTYDLNPRWLTYIWSRIAIGVMAASDDPAHAIRLYEDITHLFPPYVDDRVQGMSFSLAPQFVRSRLQGLYERVERFDDALNLSIPSANEIGWPRTGTEQYQSIARHFDGWMEQLQKAAGIAEVKRFLDLTYRLIKKVDGIDREERVQLSVCPYDTRQYWAWYYGYALGQLLASRPSLRESLFGELEAEDWDEGWPAGGVLFDSSDDSWEEYRSRCLRFYHSADIEFLERGGSLFGERTPYGERQPPHLSPQSDLYWAIRVGFADAHLQNSVERPESRNDIAGTLERVATTVGSTAQHVLRTEREMDRHWEDIRKGLPPKEEYWREELRRILDTVYEVLPEPTIQHLIKASDRGYANDSDGQRVTTAQAVESLFQELLEPRILEDPSPKEPILIVPQRRGKPKKYPKGNWHMIQVSSWAQILRTTGAGGRNEDLGKALGKSFSNLSLDAVVALYQELEKIAELRGDASHHSQDSEQDKAKKAEALWSLVVGGVGYAGFLTRFSLAFGLIMARDDLRGQRSEGTE